MTTESTVDLSFLCSGATNSSAFLNGCSISPKELQTKQNKSQKNKTPWKFEFCVLSDVILAFGVPPRPAACDICMGGRDLGVPQGLGFQKKGLVEASPKVAQLSFPTFLELLQKVLNPKLSKADVPGHPVTRDTEGKHPSLVLGAGNARGSSAAPAPPGGLSVTGRD